MNNNFSYPDNFLRYLGTGGARFAMLRQIRKTGGIWFSYGGLNGLIDPGPGSLYHICTSSPRLDPHELRAIFLTHKHLDHSTDINVTAEAMTLSIFLKARCTSTSASSVSLSFSPDEDSSKSGYSWRFRPARSHAR